MMLSEGLLNKQIAYELSVSKRPSRRMSRRSCEARRRERTQAVIAAAKIAGGQWRQGTPTG